MDTACLETQLRTLDRQNTGIAVDADCQSPRGMAAGRAATAASSQPSSPRDFAHSADGSVRNQGREERGRVACNGSSDARSRLSGAAAGMLGGATAVVAVVTKVGEVGGWTYVG